MKKIFISILAAISIVGCSSGNGNGGPTIIKGKFIGYNNEYVEFFDLLPDGKIVEHPLNVNPDGTFCDTVQFDKNQYDAALFADKFMFRVSVEQGKTYEAEFDLTQEGVETNYKFIGEGAAENAYLAHRTAISVYDALGSVHNYQECKSMLESTYAPLQAELKTIKNKPFVKYHEHKNKQDFNNYLCYSPFLAAAATGSYADDPEFDAFIKKNYKLSDEEFDKTMGAVFTNVSYMLDGIDATAALKAAESCATTKEQKELAMNLMLTALAGSGNFNGIAQAYDYFQDEVTNDDYLDVADSLCKNAMMLAPGIPAPDIEFKDQAGKVYHLADFAGKPLYIDLWASWCGPCCEEIPHLKALAESLGADPAIQCISISIDDEESDWTTKLDEVKPTWPQFLATAAGQQAISGQYNITGIPRFMLLDASGKIVSVNAPRPSDDNILAQLNDMLCAE